MPGGTTLRETADLTAAIERSADARTARMLLTRAVEEHPQLADELVDDPLVRDGLVALACASRSLASAVIADPSLLDPLRDADDFAQRAHRRRLPVVVAEGRRARRPRLRRWKRRELLRIAARDLLGAADMPAVGRELAALAQVCLEGALAIVGPDSPFAVIGMGKLGGRELNYASDIDVLFVHEGDADAAERTARALLATMTTPSEDGIVFRTDANLRPEGRAGPADPHARQLRELLGRLGAHVGVPGADQGSARGRRSPTSARASWSWRHRACGRRSSTPTRSARSAP